MTEIVVRGLISLLQLRGIYNNIVKYILLSFLMNYLRKIFFECKYCGLIIETDIYKIRPWQWILQKRFLILFNLVNELFFEFHMDQRSLLF